jgi:hypothetical protein
MIDATYAPQLLPNPVRLDAAVDALGRKVAGGEADQALLAFLLAYLGHQRADQSLVDRGLAAMATAAPKDPMLPLLRQVWSEKSPGDFSADQQHER